ncbi:MAG: penicillin-binding protein 1C [Flavobacteriaceae bacterium]|jgi:penicillin-binding protein 1C
MKKHIKKVKHFIRNAILVFLGLGIILTGLVLVWVSQMEIPNFNDFQERKVASSTKIFDKTEEVLLYDVHGDIKRTLISFEEMGDPITEAIVAIEDRNFYKHSGISPRGIVRAFVTNIKNAGLSQGGSTLTQQLVKNTLLTRERKISRKLKEVVLSFKIERVLSKKEILELYLNEAPFGGSMYGIAEASQTFFGKKPTDLTYGESAYLAAIPKAPTYFSPYGKNKEYLDKRAFQVLFNLREQGFITEDIYREAREEEVEFLPQSPTGIRAPHFTLFIREYLEEKYGTEEIETRGLKVVTTLDYDLQEKAEEMALRYALKNEEDWNASNTSLVAIDPLTGQILTMIGSRDYFDKDIDGNFNVATASRQPGSSFKPFIYGAAFEKGYTDKTILFDTRTQFQASCEPTNLSSEEDCYSPQNYDGKELGPVTLREALAQSRNIPAVKLLYLTGLSNSLSIAKKMGITTLGNSNTYGLTLVLGGGEVRLLDMVSSYGTFATEGIHYEPTGILRIEDRDGNILEEYSSLDQERVISTNSARAVSDILSDDDSRVPLFGRNSLMNIPGYSVAAKTGTTNNNKDAWLIGYSPELAVGVWTGNNDNTPMDRGSSISIPFWNEFMTLALKKTQGVTFNKPSFSYENIPPVMRGIWHGGEGVEIDTISGKLATEYTPKETRKEIITTNVHSILHWIDINNPTQKREDGFNRQYKAWEEGVLRWWNENKGNFTIVDKDDIPTEYDDIHLENPELDIEIISPEINSYIDQSDTLKVEFKYEGEYKLIKSEFFINGVFAGSQNSNREEYILELSDFIFNEQINTLTIKVFDKIYNSKESNIKFNIDF